MCVYIYIYILWMSILYILIIPEHGSSRQVPAFSRAPRPQRAPPRVGSLTPSLGRNRACLGHDVRRWVGSTGPTPIAMRATLAIQTYSCIVMDLARGTYSSVHVLVGACLGPSDSSFPCLHRLVSSTSTP